ncbi:MATE family efflux transporter [Clostridium sediminicola]|uniref:MATE family efflux transporter n=1 Tax=Clostridium sediminicola TaxID=3114879 RepID=UPI0031F25107
MVGSKDLTKGNTMSSLVKLAIPLIATNFIQTAYSLIDMIWIGKLGSNAVAAVGTASFFINMAFAIFTLVVTGTSIRVSQSFGAKDYEKTKKIIVNGFFMALILSIVYSVTIIFFRYRIIGFFDFTDEGIKKMASNYLFISMLGVVFMYFNSLFSTIYNSLGNSKFSFKVNSIGFIVNVILDPILIFGVSDFTGLGVGGAAIASIVSRFIVTVIFLINYKKSFKSFVLKLGFDFKLAFDSVKLGAPFTVQRVTFIAIGIVIAKIISAWGPTGIAVQKIGVQIESISYMTIAGLHGAVSVFIGQNYGAGSLPRIKEGYRKALSISFIYGLLTTAVLIIFSKEIFGVFIKDREAVEMGVNYLKIIGLSQVFMCIEIVSNGSFSGIGKTYVPATVSLIFTGLRIPLALFLSSFEKLGINGVWWSISISSMVKGIVLVTLFLIFMTKLKIKNDDEVSV